MASARHLDLVAENAELRAKLAEAEDMLRAIRRGEIDALVMQSDTGPRVYTLQGVDSASNRARGEMLEIISDAVIAVDGDRRVTYVNPAARRLFSLDASAVLGKPASEIPELRLLNGLIDENSLSNGEWHGEAVDKGRDSPTRHLEATLMARQKDSDGSAGILATFRDITERKQAEAAHRASEAELSRAYRIAGIGSVKVEIRDGNFVADRSPEYLAVHGLTPQDRGNSHEAWLRRLHPEDREKADRTFRECLADGRKLYESEYRIIRQNDSATRWIRVLAEIERDASGAPLRLFGTHLDVTESRLHEAALRTSETRYRRLFEAAHDGVLILDPETRKIVDANPFMTALLGYPREQLIGMELYEIGFLADAQASRDMFEALKSMRQVRYENLPLQTQKGGLRDVEVVANLYDEDGHSVVQCNVRDITERRRAETELRERQHFLNRIFEVLPGVLYVFDLDENRVVFVSNTAELTYSSEEIAGMGADVVRNLMHPDDQQGFQEHIARIRTLDPGATATFEYRMRDKADEWRWYLSTDTVFLRDASGAARQFIGVAPEITDRKRAEFALRESEARQHQVLKASRIGTFDVDIGSGEATWNPTQFELLGLRPGEATPGTATFFRHVHPEDLHGLQAIWKAAIESGTLDAEFRIIRADGAIRWLGARGDISHDQTGDESRRERRYLGVNFDITERKEQEEHLRFLMKEVNHRSKNMLGLVQAVAQQTAKTSPDDFVAHFRERIQALAGAQDLLVKSEWKAVSLSELIRSQLAHFQDLIGDRIQLHGPVVEVLPAAAQSIGMAVHELATNAGKYGALSNEIGRVEVTWDIIAGQCGEPQFVMSWTEADGPPVTRPTRRGFGSTVIGGMINMSLDCNAEIDYAPTGLRWRIACPADKLVGKAEAAKARPAPPVVQSAANGSKRVLVVEDEALIAMEIAAILSDAGFTVVGPVGSVAHALALIERSGCEAAVLDINLGNDTAEPIAHVLRARATPFVTISGYSREQQPAAFRNAPLVSKPVRPERLVAEIRKCFAEAF